MEHNSAGKKKGNLTFCDGMDGPVEYYAKWNKPSEKDKYYRCHSDVESDDQTELMNEIERLLDTENRLTAIRGEGVGGLGKKR